MAFDVLIGMALVLGVMILIHEWGHFIIARLFGVRVDVFSIGFGPRLFGWKRGATDYRLSLLPLGGYVRMAGQDLAEVDSGNQAPTGALDELMSKPRWQRALIAAAGPAVNLVFPVFLLAGFFVVVGLPHTAALLHPLEVQALPKEALANPGPLHLGDRVVALNGKSDPTWDTLQDALGRVAPGGTLRLRVENHGMTRDVQIPVESKTPYQSIFGYAPLQPVIEEAQPGMPAYRAGLRGGDRIVAANGEPIQLWGQLVDVIRHSGGNPVQLKIQRADKQLDISVTPQQGLGASDAGENIWQIGVVNKESEIYIRGSLLEAAQQAVEKTEFITVQTLAVVGKLFTGKVSVKQLQGVVGIAHVSAEAVKHGPSQVVALMAFISVNLGILNLLPIPILDGGQILLLSIEGLMRRDLSLAFKERFIQVGLVFLLVLFAYVMYNDVVRLLPMHS